MPAIMDIATATAGFSHLAARQYGNPYNNRYNNQNRWNSWVRWLVLGLVIFGAVAIFFLFSCITARRRRKRGFQPFRGTAWAAGRPPPGHGSANYYGGNNNNHNNNDQPYNGASQPYYGNTNQGAAPPPAYGQSQSYYGQQQPGVELQQPQQTYQPPSGPPPGKAGHDGIIR